MPRLPRLNLQSARINDSDPFDSKLNLDTAKNWSNPIMKQMGYATQRNWRNYEIDGDRGLQLKNAVNEYMEH